MSRGDWSTCCKTMKLWLTLWGYGFVGLHIIGVNLRTVAACDRLIDGDRSWPIPRQIKQTSHLWKWGNNQINYESVSNRYAIFKTTFDSRIIGSCLGLEEVTICPFILRFLYPIIFWLTFFQPGSIPVSESIAFSENSSTVKRKNPSQPIARFAPTASATAEFWQLSRAIGKITGTIELLSAALNPSVISRSPTYT